MTISIVIPVYNMESYLEKCIKSILSQGYNDYEAVLVDDGSHDRSLDICESYARSDSRIRVVSQINQGVSEARNAGIQAAVGKFITFIDPDDWIENDYLGSLVDSIDDFDLVVAGYKVHGFENYFPGNRTFFPVGSYSRNDFLRHFPEFRNVNALSGILTSPFSKLFRTSIIKDNGLKFERGLSLGEDYLFILNYIVICDRIRIIGSTSYSYLIRQNSLSRGVTQKFLSSQVYLYDKTKDFFQKYIVPLEPATGIGLYAKDQFYQISITCFNSTTLSLQEKYEIYKKIKSSFSVQDISFTTPGAFTNTLLAKAIYYLPFFIISCVFSLKNISKTFFKRAISLMMGIKCLIA